MTNPVAPVTKTLIEGNTRAPRRVPRLPRGQGGSYEHCHHRSRECRWRAREIKRASGSHSHVERKGPVACRGEGERNGGARGIEDGRWGERCRCGHPRRALHRRRLVIAELGDALAGKVLIDVTNRMKREAIAESVDGTSAAEQIQK